MPRSWFPEISRDYHKHCNPCWSFLEQIWQNQFLWRWQKPSKGLEPSLCHYFDRFYVCLRPLVFTLSCFALPRGIPVTNHAVLDHQVVQSFALEVNSKFCPEQKHWVEDLFFSLICVGRCLHPHIFLSYIQDILLMKVIWEGMFDMKFIAL